MLICSWFVTGLICCNIINFTSRIDCCYELLIFRRFIQYLSNECVEF